HLAAGRASGKHHTFGFECDRFRCSASVIVRILGCATTRATTKESTMTFTFTRTMTTGLALTTGALLLAGCGVGDSPGDATKPAASTGEVEVVWKGDADRAASIQEALDLFNEANPDVKITTDYQSGGE